MSGCSGPISPSPPPPPPPAPEPQTPNNPPRILELIVSAERIEVGEEVTLTANVADDETSADELMYEWQAASGSFSGTGRTVKWRAPMDMATPATYRISLIVIDRYGSGQQTLEHRVNGETSEIHVDDSPKTVRTLSEEFLRDFADSSVEPDTCLQNFHDSCPGKRRERDDIVRNRNLFTIISSKVSVSRVRVNLSRTDAEVLAACEFTSIRKTTGRIEVARGTCELDLVNRNNRWWLCESSFHGDAQTLRLGFIF